MQSREIQSLLSKAIAPKEYLPRDAARAIPSAVLLIIHYHHSPDTPHIFLTKRSSSVMSHRGEISFPGGKYVKEDRTLLATALRETEEEIGISFKPGDVMGSLRAVRTMTSNHFIVPFVTLQKHLPEHKIAANEVEAVIDTPLLVTLRSIQPDVEHYRLAKDAFKFSCGEYVIWGATARIMKQLYDLLIGV